MMDMSPSLRLPEAACEQQQNGEDLQTAHHHVEGQQPLGRKMDVAEGTTRSGDARARAVVAEAGQVRHARLLHAHAHGGEQHHVDHEQDDEQREKRHHTPYRHLLDGLVGDFDGVDA